MDSFKSSVNQLLSGFDPYQRVLLASSCSGVVGHPINTIGKRMLQCSFGGKQVGLKNGVFNNVWRGSSVTVPLVITTKSLTMWLNTECDNTFEGKTCRNF